MGQTGPVLTRAATYRDVCRISSLIGRDGAGLTLRDRRCHASAPNHKGTAMRSLTFSLLFVAFPGLAQAETVTVNVTFSDRALSEMTTRGEGVVVSAYWMGEPAEAATLPTNEVGTIFLLSEDITLQPGPAQVVLGGSLAAAPLDQVTVPMLNVNVFSARWTSEDNLIDCGFLDAPMAELAAAPQSITCKLIGE
jgi:hypothetical protein